MDVSDEMLMAYADGELPGAEGVLVAAALAADPALAARLTAFQQSRVAVALAFGALPAAHPDDPVAARIRALAAAQMPSQQPEQGAQVFTFAPRPDTKAPAPRTFWQVPLAASVALAVGLSGGQMIWGGGSSAYPAGAGGLMAGDPDLHAALNGLPSGARQDLKSGAQVAMIASFENGAGALCREFELDQPDGATTVAVACRTGTDAVWDVQLAIAADAGTQGYAPASSLEALDAWLGATGAGAPLTPSDEAKALAGDPS